MPGRLSRVNRLRVQNASAAAHLLRDVDVLDGHEAGAEGGDASAVDHKGRRAWDRLEQVRTAGRALARLEDLAVTAADGNDVDIAVQHLGSAERAQTLAEHLRERLPQVDVIEGLVGGVVGAHVGPGMVAVVIAPRFDEGAPTS